jgi:succinate dehydrogenase / fumarate reductase, iron-sulfur subunit
MVLDALHLIKWEIDPTLAFRRSCREGICGSCSMNIDGVNVLACLEPIEACKEVVTIYPLPHTRVIRDLVPDLGRFFAHYRNMKPSLEGGRVEGERENLQSPREREKLDGLYECILCACCSTACPSYWWNEESFPGPAALLQLQRWVEDSRDQAGDKRLDIAEAPMGHSGCRQILNCTKVCPKGLNPAKAISDLRRMGLERSLRKSGD